MTRYTRPAVATPADQICDDMIAGAIAYSDGRISNYRTGYEAFWKLDRWGMEVMQAAIDHDQAMIIKILIESAKEVGALAAQFPDSIGDGEGQLPVKYTSSPYDYQIDAALFQDGHTEATVAAADLGAAMAAHGMLTGGRIVLLGLKAAWVQEG